MKNLSKYLILAALLQVVCHAHPVNAGGLPALSMDHFTMYVASFIEKMEKVNTYMKEIKETTKTIDSLGEVGVNAAVSMLKGDMSGLTKFMDKLHFGDLGSALGGIQSETLQNALGKVSDTVSGAMDTIKDSAGSMIDSVKGAASDALDTVKGAASAAMEKVQNSEWAQKAYSSVKDATSGAVDSITSAASEAADKVRDFASAAMEKANEAGYGDIAGKVQGVASSAMGTIERTATNAIDDVKDVATNAIDNIGKKGIQGTIDDVKDIGTNTLNRVEKAVSGAVSDATTAGVKEATGRINGLAAEAVGKITQTANEAVDEIKTVASDTGKKYGWEDMPSTTSKTDQVIQEREKKMDTTVSGDKTVKGGS